MLSTVTRSVIRTPMTRSFRTSALSRSAHDEYHHLPFPWPHSSSSRKIFGASIVTYLGIGFALPFVAAVYQLNKSAGSSD